MTNKKVELRLANLEYTVGNLEKKIQLLDKRFLAQKEQRVDIATNLILKVSREKVRSALPWRCLGKNIQIDVVITGPFENWNKKVSYSKIEVTLKNQFCSRQWKREIVFEDDSLDMVLKQMKKYSGKTINNLLFK